MFGRLTPKERSQIEKHVEVGVGILKGISSCQDVAQMIADHHERWDGKGYPMGRQGLELSLGGRILGVADAYDAMTSPK